MSEVTYLLVTNSVFDISTNTGLLHDIPTDSTTVNTYELVRQHKVVLTTYQEVYNTDRALKQIIIETFDDIRYPNIGFTGTTVMVLLTRIRFKN